MPDVPDMLDLGRHRDRAYTGATVGLWARRVVLGLIAAICILGLLNVFGQHPATLRASSPEASLALYTTHAARGGDFVESRFRIAAHQTIGNAVIVLDPGWAEGVSLNTIEPSPVNETSRDGHLALSLGRIAAGRTFTFYIQIQVNPTNVAWRRTEGVELDDGSRTLLHIHRTMTIFP